MNLRMRTLGPPIGLSIAVWGLVAAVPAVSWVYGSLFWVVVALCAGWGLAYAMRPVTLNLSLIQLVSLMVVTAVAAAVDANDPTMLMAGMLGWLWWALWMVPVFVVQRLMLGPAQDPRRAPDPSQSPEEDTDPDANQHGSNPLPTADQVDEPQDSPRP